VGLEPGLGLVHQQQQVRKVMLQQEELLQNSQGNAAVSPARGLQLVAVLTQLCQQRPTQSSSSCSCSNSCAAQLLAMFGASVLWMHRLGSKSSSSSRNQQLQV
jgi:hypothetical protein